MFKTFFNFKRITTILILMGLLIQGVVGLSQINVNAADFIVDLRNTNGNISSLNNCGVFLSGVALINPIEPVSRSGDVGPCIDDSGKLFYDCVDTDLTHGDPSNTTKALCKRGLNAPATCYDFPTRLLGAGTRDIVLKNTEECTDKLKEMCATQWDANTSGKLKESCRSIYPAGKPSVGIIADNGQVSLAVCDKTFTDKDKVDLEKSDLTKKKPDGTYPLGVCKDAAGSLFLCTPPATAGGPSTNCGAVNKAAKDNNTVVETKVEDKSISNSIVGIMLGLLSVVLLVIFYILNWALSFVLWVLGLIFINILVINPVSVEYIQVAKAPWQILVNIANLLTLSSLIFVGIGYILNIKSLKIGIQQLLLNVTIFSLLLNFTLLGLQGVTTITQGVGDAMIAARSGQPPAFISGGQNKLLDSVLTGVKGISLIRCGNQNLDGLATKCQTGADGNDVKTATDANGLGDFGNLTTAIGNDAADILQGKIGDKILRAMMLEVVYTMVLLYTISVMFKAGMMVLVRLVAFWLLLIVSPLALAAYFMPVPSIKKYAGQWAEKTWQLAIFYPVAVLLLILISEIVSQFAGAINKSVGGAATTATGNTAYLDTIQAYALTGDFGGVFTALLSSILIGVVGAAAFGAMGTFLDKFLGPIAKALGDGIKSAASTLGTAGYVTGAGIRMGVGMAGKVANTGAIKNMLNKSPIAQRVAKILPQRLLQNRENSARAARLESTEGFRRVVDINRARRASGEALIDETEARAKFAANNAAFARAKQMNDRYKGGKNKIGAGVRRVSNSKFVTGTSKFARGAGNSLLDTMQFGVSDVANQIAMGGTLWNALGKKRKAEEAGRKANGRAKFEAGLVRMQGRSQVASQLLEYSDLNSFRGLYVPGEDADLTQEQIDAQIKRVTDQEFNLAGGVKTDFSVGQARKFIEKYRDRQFKDLTKAQQGIMQDIYEKASTNSGFAEGVSLLEKDQDYLARNAYDAVDFTTIKQLAKSAPQLLVNKNGFVGDQAEEVDGSVNSANNSRIRDELETFARSYAQSSPESDIRKSASASGIANNRIMMRVIDEVSPSLAGELRERGNLTKDFNNSYSVAETQAVANQFNSGKEVQDSSGNAVAIEPNVRSAMGVALVASGAARAEKGYGSTNQLRVALVRAGDDENARKAAYEKFYKNEYGISGVSEDSLKSMSLADLQQGNLSRAAMSKLAGYDQLSGSQKEVYLRSNLQAAWKSFARSETSFKANNQLEVDKANRLYASTANQEGFADDLASTQRAIADEATRNPEAVANLRQNGEVLEAIEEFNSTASPANQINLGEGGLLEYVAEQERSRQLAPVEAELERVNQGIQTSQAESASFESQIQVQNEVIEVQRQERENFNIQLQQAQTELAGVVDIIGIDNAARRQVFQDRIDYSTQQIQTRDVNINNANQQITATSQRQQASGHTSARLNELNTRRGVLGDQRSQIQRTTNAQNVDLRTVRAATPAYLVSQGVATNANVSNAITARLQNVRDVSELQTLGSTNTRDLTINIGNNERISYRTDAMMPQIATASDDFNKMLSEQGVVSYNGLSTDTRNSGKITEATQKKFAEGMAGVMQTIFTKMKTADTNGTRYEFTPDEFNAIVTDSKNSEWGSTELADALGQQLGFKRGTDKKFIRDANSAGKGMFEPESLLREGRTRVNRDTARAGYGGNINAGIVAGTETAATQAENRRGQALQNTAQSNARSGLVRLAMARRNP